MQSRILLPVHVEPYTHLLRLCVQYRRRQEQSGHIWVIIPVRIQPWLVRKRIIKLQKAFFQPAFLCLHGQHPAFQADLITRLPVFPRPHADAQPTGIPVIPAPFLLGPSTSGDAAPRGLSHMDLCRHRIYRGHDGRPQMPCQPLKESPVRLLQLVKRPSDHPVLHMEIQPGSRCVRQHLLHHLPVSHGYILKGPGLFPAVKEPRSGRPSHDDLISTAFLHHLSRFQYPGKEQAIPGSEPDCGP